MLSFREPRTPEAEFPRIVFGGNSPRCIKTDASEGHDYCRSLPMRPLGSVLPSHLKRSALLSLEFAAVCNVSRILMHDAA
jgi:hypothetical protein